MGGGGAAELQGPGMGIATVGLGGRGSDWKDRLHLQSLPKLLKSERLGLTTPELSFQEPWGGEQGVRGVSAGQFLPSLTSLF